MSRPPKRKPRPDSRKPGSPKSGSAGKPRPQRRRDQLALQALGGGEYVLVSPECALDRQEDVDEVHDMISAEEFEIARDELLYLVSDCEGFLAAHNLLAELALEENKVAVARGHFGFCYENVLELLTPKFKGRLAAEHPINEQFFLAGCGLARCLIAEGDFAGGREVLEFLQRLDSAHYLSADLLAQLAEREAEAKAAPPPTPTPKPGANLLPILPSDPDDADDD